MGAYERRQLRAAFGLLFYPMLLAILLTVLVKQLFTHKSLKPLPSPSTPTLDPDLASSSGHSISKTLVVASTTHDDTAWLAQIPPALNWTVAHYRVDAPLSPALSVPSTNGNEAMVYLTYIIDHYEILPDVIFFHHAHLKAWHQKRTSLEELAHLRPSYVLKAGYASTRCLSGCENIVKLAGGQPGAFPAFASLDRKTQLVTLLDAFLEEEKGETVPPRIAAPCCAQFAVSREAVRRREREWWVDLRAWVANTPLKSMNSGRLMEHLWHLWFGMEAEL